MRNLLLVGAVLAATQLTACSTNPVSGKKEIVMRSEQGEIKKGKEMHAQILATNSPYPDTELQEYVNEIGQKVAATSERAHLDFHFVVLDDEIVNAFALPGGYIYITRGLMAHLNSEAELAAVLGHEIGHVTARHGVKRETSGNLLNAAAAIATIATGTNAAGAATGILGGAFVSGYSRDQELEADALGAKYISKVGYPTEATSSAIELLKRKEQFEIEQARAEGRKARTPHGIFSTHPDNDQRLIEAIAAARQYAGDAALGHNQQVYLDKIDGLKWGPKKSPGAFRNNWYFNRQFGVKMKFPEDWRISGEPSRVQAVSPDNEHTLQVFVLRVKRGSDVTPEDVLKRALGLPSIKGGKDITVANMPAFLAEAQRYDSPYGARPARAAAVIDARRGLAYVFAGSGKRDLSRVSADKNFIGSIFSLDRMSREERTLAKAPKVKVVRAEAGTTIAELAKNSAVPAFAEQHIRLINGLYPSGEPKAGQLIKTVD